jgi:hypothetical protein
LAVSEEDVKEDEIIQDDFKKAKEIMKRIEKVTHPKVHSDTDILLFALCLIYARQLEHHKKEEANR